MLVSHLNAIEAVLLAQSKAAANAGHPNLRGGPREWFIREFLEGHLPSTLEIGQGEIIDVDSRPSPSPGEYRPQVDIAVYRRDVPKIFYARDHAAYLVEGVMATIESKSLLTRDELLAAVKATAAHKKLKRQPFTGFTTGWRPDAVVSYVIAFDGPVQMATVAGWLPPIAAELGIAPEGLVDMIVVLGKGVAWSRAAFPALALSSAPADHDWAFINQADKNLFVLFTHMLTWAASSSSPPNTLAYAGRVSLAGIHTFKSAS